MPDFSIKDECKFLCLLVLSPLNSSALSHVFIVLIFVTFFLLLIKIFLCFKNFNDGFLIFLEFAFVSLLFDVQSGLMVVRMGLRKY